MAGERGARCASVKSAAGTPGGGEAGASRFHNQTLRRSFADDMSRDIARYMA